MDPLSSEGTEASGTKPDFIGKIVDAAIESEEYPSQFESENLTVDLLYEIDVLAVDDGEGGWEDRGWQNQTQRWVDVNTTVQTGNPPSTSKWMVVVNRLEAIEGNLAEAVGAGDAESEREYVQKLLDWLTGKTFKFSEWDWSEDEPEMEFTAIDQQTGDRMEVTIRPSDIQANTSESMNEFIVPTGKPDDDEIVDLTGESDDDVDEVEEVDVSDL